MSSKGVSALTADSIIAKNTITKERIMKIKELLEEVRAEIANDDKETAKAILKNNLLEIREAQKVLAILEKETEALLAKDVDDVV